MQLYNHYVRKQPMLRESRNLKSYKEPTTVVLKLGSQPNVGKLPPKIMQQNPTTEVRRIKNKSISQHINNNPQFNYYKQTHKRIIYDSTNCLNSQINRSSSNRIKKIHSVSSHNYESFLQNVEDQSKNCAITYEDASGTELNEAKRLFSENKLQEAAKLFQNYLIQYGHNPEALYICGLCYNSLNQIEKSIEQFKNLITTFPTYKRNTYLLLANLLKKMNKFQESIQVLSQGLSYFNRYYEALIFRGKLYMKDKQIDKAQKDFSLAVQINARNSIGYLGLSECYKLQNQLPYAIEQLNRALDCQEDAKQKQILTKRFLLYLDLKDFPKAITDIEILLELAPYDSEIFYLKGFLMQKQKRIQEALLAFEQAIKFNSDKKPVTKALYEIVKIKIDQNDYYSAQHELERASYLDIDKSQLQRFELFVEGVIHLMKRKFEEGTSSLTEMITKNQSSDNLKFLAHQYRAYGYFCQSKYNLAKQDLELYQESLLEKASLYNKQLCYGILKFEDNELEQSKKYFQQAQKMMPLKVEPLFYLAIISIRKYCQAFLHQQEKSKPNHKNLYEALELLERAALINQHYNVLFYKGIVNFALGQLDVASFDIDTAIDKSDDNQSIHYFVRGILHACKRMYKQAINDLTICLSLDALYADSYLYRSKLLIFLGDVGNAYIDLQKYIELKQQYSIDYAMIGVMFFYIGAFDESIVAFNMATKNFENQYSKVKVLVYTKELNLALQEIQELQQSAFNSHAQTDFQVLQILKQTSQEFTKKSLEDGLIVLDKYEKNNESGIIFKLADIYFYKALIYFYIQQYGKADQYVKLSFQEKEKEFSDSKGNEQLQNCFEEFDFTNKIYNIFEYFYNLSIIEIMNGNIEEAFNNLGLLHENLTQMEFKVQVQTLMEILRDDLLDTPPNEEFKKIDEFQLFPQHNRLCSIYPAVNLPLQKYHIAIKLSFCLPTIEFEQEKINFDYQLLHSITPKVVENKPEAPWIKRSFEGVVFTDNVRMIEDLDLQSTTRIEDPPSEQSRDNDLKQLKERLKLDDDISKKLNSIMRQSDE